MKTIIKISIISISLLLTACPHKQTSQNDSANPDTVQLEQELAKTSTGQDSVNYLNSLRQSGYQIKIVYLITSELKSKNGHSGGAISRNGQVITIFINKEIALTDQVHVLAHELVHVKDDFEMDVIESDYPYIRSEVENFLNNYKQNGINSFDNRVTNYVLNSLFCVEARAYTKNALLVQQGYPTQLINTVNIGTYINQNYIIKDFNTSYGSSAEAMNDWCLQFSSMSEIQKQLIW